MKKKKNIKNVPVKKVKGKLDEKPKPKVSDEFAEFDQFDSETDDGGGREDKIFNNSYNTGNIKFNDFPNINIDEGYMDSHMEDVYSAEDYEIRKRLMTQCDEVFKASQWNTLPTDRKIPKELLPFVFNEIFMKMDENGAAAKDIFITIAEYLEINYDKLYDAAGIKIKERIVYEMNQKYGSIKKKNLNRLF